MAATKGFKFRYLKSLHGKKLSDKHYRILVTLLDYAEGDGTNAHPGNEVLARDCNCHVQTVKTALAWLTAHGYIILVRRGRKNCGASVYRFPEDLQGSRSDTLKDNLKVQSDTISAGVQGTTQTVRHHTNTSTTGSKMLPSGEYVGGSSWESRDSSGSPDGDRDGVGFTLAGARGYPQVNEQVKQYQDYWTSSPSGEDVDDESPVVGVGSQEQSSAAPRMSTCWCSDCGKPITDRECKQTGDGTHTAYRFFHLGCSNSDPWAGPETIVATP
ncbi:helix-turn-helix domain-containing protein [Mycolicibacterium farcinogenes]|uniref:Helix-turn-helix domain-containing protein n=1 Tax=Mycolicibacterium farcinogenes TaxID=1802 RepID=A0ACD1FN34_MYCFR|nr:helix-turn-helix domain-containing protein [Mycolicibacterium farcinogenes]QZH68317.1 helix-turn-helix domain-containing protein [Mycolicibacterium farcinogenes]